MTKEASVFEYREIIIPLHEEELKRDLVRIQKYPPESIERAALILAARLKEIHIQYIKLHIIELQGGSLEVSEAIKTNKRLENKVRLELEAINIDVRDL